ncbi:MAG: MotA/TolQ/ExbB proton channel family protein [Deltaproteobacteria bacterium]|nr:MotA/TolQ/ExbB proton channel family protein [Deltaproteobacteria bacterium]
MESLAAFFRDGGIFMYFILFVSVIGLAIIVERGIFLLLKNNIDGKALWAKIHKFALDGQYDKAMELCTDSRLPLLKVLRHGISTAAKRNRDVQGAMDEIVLEVMPTVDKRITYLATLANIATLLGLLGTIQGLIQAFAAVSSADPSQKAEILSRGIAIALYTTAFGLIVAIPLLAMYTVLQSKAHTIIDEIDEYSIKLVNLIADRKAQPNPAPAHHEEKKTEEKPAAVQGAPAVQNPAGIQNPK